MSKQILLVDDSAFLRRAVRIYLETRPDLNICGEAGDGLEGIEKAEGLKPDLIILDYSMPRMDGLQAGSPVDSRRVAPDAPIILFTLFAEAMSKKPPSGVASIISKTSRLSVLADEVEKLLGITAATPYAQSGA